MVIIISGFLKKQTYKPLSAAEKLTKHVFELGEYEQEKKYCDLWEAGDPLFHVVEIEGIHLGGKAGFTFTSKREWFLLSKRKQKCTKSETQAGQRDKSLSRHSC